MIVLAWGTFLLLAAFIFHLIVWRIRLPQKHTRTLAIIFYGTFLAWCLLVWGWSTIGVAWEPYFPSRLSEYVHILLYYCAVTFVYIGVYTLFEVDSPSLLIIDRISEAETEGLAQDKLYDSLGDNILVVPRINDLVRDEMAVLENGKYKITSKGTIMVQTLLFHRKIMKADHKGG